MEYLKDAKGLIIDVRGNKGGYINLASKLASYFTLSEVEVGTNYIKNGPGKNDFAASKMKLKPSENPYTFTKPVIVIQDRSTFSSGSLFCIMMNSLDHVSSMGIPFGGGTGDIMDGFLANGWKWVISTSNFVNNDGIPTDPGLEVEIPMVINQEFTITDAMIERAILELQ
jgi:C-terminal processing protease CtpA/Prc